MVTKISLNIPDDSYKELSRLADFYKLDVKDTILNILSEIGKSNDLIMNLSKQYKVPSESLGIAMSNILSLSQDTYYMIQRAVLDSFNVRGPYLMNHMEIDLEDVSMHFHFTGYAEDYNSLIGEFSFTVDTSQKTLQTYSVIEVEKVEKRALEKLKEIVKDFEMPEDFGELESCEFIIDESDDEYWNLEIDCFAESLSDFPSLSTISKTVSKILKKAGITESREPIGS
jgi:hypothetical protein